MMMLLLLLLIVLAGDAVELFGVGGCCGAPSASTASGGNFDGNNSEVARMTRAIKDAGDDGSVDRRTGGKKDVLLLMLDARTVDDGLCTSPGRLNLTTMASQRAKKVPSFWKLAGVL